MVCFFCSALTVIMCSIFPTLLLYHSWMFLSVSYAMAWFQCFASVFLCVFGSESDQDWHLALNELPRLHCLNVDRTKFRIDCVALFHGIVFDTRNVNDPFETASWGHTDRAMLPQSPSQTPLWKCLHPNLDLLKLCSLMSPPAAKNPHPVLWNHQIALEYWKNNPHPSANNPSGTTPNCLHMTNNVTQSPSPCLFSNSRGPNNHLLENRNVIVGE